MESITEVEGKDQWLNTAMELSSECSDFQNQRSSHPKAVLEGRLELWFNWMVSKTSTQRESPGPKS